MDEKDVNIIELQPEGTFARKPDFHGKPAKVKIVGITQRVNNWDKKEWQLTFKGSDDEEQMLSISNKNVNFLIKSFGNDRREWIDKEVTLESVYDGEIEIKEGDEVKKVEAYTLIIS